MGYKNTVTIISGNEFAIEELKSMLVLLRDVDSVTSADYYDAEDFIKQIKPSVVILHAANNDKNALKILNKINGLKNTEDIPVILFADYCGADFIIEAFDSGISDIITSPLKDYELVIRVIWAIQKNAHDAALKNNNRFLTDLGIIDEETGFYKEEFSKKYLESVVTRSKTENACSCLMLLKCIPNVEGGLNTRYFAHSLLDSIRKNDTVAKKDNSSFYIFLSRAKLNGVYSVFERIQKNLSSYASACASVVEIGEEFFDDTMHALDISINKCTKNNGLIVVQKKDFEELYRYDTEEELGISKLLKQYDNKEPLAIPESKDYEYDFINQETTEDTKTEEEDKISLGLKLMDEQVKKITKNKSVIKEEKSILKKEPEEKSVDERNAGLYHQTYKKKLKMVVEPLFKKYAAKLQSKFELLDANINVTPEITFMKLDKDDVKLDFEMIYNGLKQVSIKLSIYALGTEIETERFEFEVMKFDYQTLDTILKTVIDEYKNYLTQDD